MLRLIALASFGLWAGLMVFGRDLSPDEQTSLDTRRAERTPLTTQISNTFASAFGTDTHRQGAYVPTLAELPSRVAEPKATAAAQLQLASAPLNSSVTTRVTDPAKLAAVLHPAAQPAIAETAPSAEDMILREVTATRVNVRSGPSTATPVLGQVVHAEIVRLLTPVENGWVKISVEGDGVEGYMAAKFLTEVSQ